MRHSGLAVQGNPEDVRKKLLEHAQEYASDLHKPGDSSLDSPDFVCRKGVSYDEFMRERQGDQPQNFGGRGTFGLCRAVPMLATHVVGVSRVQARG